MLKRLNLPLCMLAGGVSLAWSMAMVPPDAVSPVVPLAVAPFSLAQVQLLEGPFKSNQDQMVKVLKELEPDRLLYSFRQNAGLPTTAKPYGGWEEPKCELRGHAVGHYLSGCALAYQRTGDETLKENAARVVAGMAECQEKFPGGYLSAFPEELIDRVEAGKPVWAPWYTLHKIYAGLLDQYQLCGNKQALEVLKKTIGWMSGRLGRLSDQKVQAMLGNEHGGVNEVLANLYAITGEKEYLALSKRFNHRLVLDAAMAGKDNLDGLHTNTQFPKVIGLARQYELTGDAASRAGVEFLWKSVVYERSYVNGGDGDDEFFTPKSRFSTGLSAGRGTSEFCCTYNMLKLTRQLMTWEPKAEYADYYERALFNHMIAQQNPENGYVLYYYPMRSGSQRQKAFGDWSHHFWCCHGSAMESHAKHGDSAYFHNDKELYVSLFMASELNWKEKGLQVRQETEFPLKPSSRLHFTASQPVNLTLQVRHPYWATKDFAIRINGQPQRETGQPGSFVAISRTWSSGDTLEIHMPFTLRTEAFRDDPQRMAVMYGPVVLCGITTPGNNVSIIHGESAKALQELTPGSAPLTFKGPASRFVTNLDATAGEIEFVPLYQEYRRPYAVYWDVFNEQRWEEKKAQVKAQQQQQMELERRCVDRLSFFDQDDRDHRYAGQNSGTGTHNSRRWRAAENGGWFQYELKVESGVKQLLRCTYWGSDTGRKFDILIDGQKIATQRLEKEKREEYFDREYELPAELLAGKKSVTVRFQAVPNGKAGGLFGCGIYRAPEGH